MAVVEDKTIIDEAEAVIDAAYTDAAAALVPAELIDEANAEAVAATPTNTTDQSGGRE